MSRALGDNLKRWRAAAEIDWFSQFIKAWIPFNAWLTDTYGELTDRQLLDRLIAGNNVIYNRIVPMLNPDEDRSQAASDFRLHVAELHRLLQGCVIDGRRGRVSFERVDMGENSHLNEQQTYRLFRFHVKRNFPTRPSVSLEVVNSRGVTVFSLVQPEFSRTELENDRTFIALKDWQRDKLLSCHDAVRPRIIESALAPIGARESLNYGSFEFSSDPRKVFKALIDVLYGVRNALFHGSITPNQQHNEIYSPAFHLVMRLVKCTE